MKKIITILFSLMTSGLCIFGIDYSIGGRINFNFSSLTADSSIYANKGFIFGGGFSTVGYIEFTENFILQPEVSFNCQNGMYFTFNNKNQTLSFSTIDIPVMVKGQVQIGPGYLGINLGPQFSFIVSDIISKDDNTTIKRSISEEQFNVFLFGFVTGLNYDLSVGPGMISFDIRFIMDFTGIAISEKNLGNRIRLSPSIGYIYRF